MDDKRTSSLSLGALVLALVAFAGGFALAWVLRGQTIVVTPAEAPQEQTIVQTGQDAGAQDEADAGEADVGEQSDEDSSGGGSSGGGNVTIDIDENGSYSTKDEVALYIHTYGHLPPNYISKTKARKAGWVANEGNLWDVLPGMSIGGSEFYNDEGQLPDAPGRTWTECDINYQGGYRGAERIVFSDDGLIFYTDDHYDTFTEITFD